MFWYWKSSFHLNLPNNLSIKHANSITWLIITGKQENYCFLHCYKWNSEGLMEKKLQVSHFPLYYWVGTTHWDQLSVGHKRNDSEVHHRSSCLPLWSASHQQCGHQTLQLEGTCESHPLQHPAQEGQLELDSGWLTMNVNETQQKHQG